MPAALEEKAPVTTGPALAAKKAVPAEKEAPLAKKEAPPKQMEMFDNRLLSETARKRHRLIGQVFETYWLVEYDGSLYIIDQHAAHEKVFAKELQRSAVKRRRKRLLPSEGLADEIRQGCVPRRTEKPLKVERRKTRPGRRRLAVLPFLSPGGHHPFLALDHTDRLFSSVLYSVTV